MKGLLITAGWMVFWVALTLSLQSCINIPPPAPMGDGAVQQIGLINTLSNPPPRQPEKPKTIVSVTSKSIVIEQPSR
jgi:hypothetical protein